MTPEEFIERYNRVTGWNKEIVDSINNDCFDRMYISNNDFVREIIEDTFDTETITGDKYDLGSATILEEDKERKFVELGIFETDGWVHFMLRLDDDDETEYKKRKICELTEAIKGEMKIIEEREKELNEKKHAVGRLQFIVNKLNRHSMLKKNIESVKGKDDFIKTICNMADQRPKDIRYGQSVYNNVDQYFGVAQKAISDNNEADCFYNDKNVGLFLDKCWDVIEEIKKSKKQ